jgi:predicted dithiol-disulfide oxidoreductase (DUF899 family)
VREFEGLREALSRQRHALPRERVPNYYIFDGARGKETFADLPGGQR